MRWMHRAAPVVATLVAACMLAGCPVNDPAPPISRMVSFAEEVQPILSEHCASCHSEGGFAVNVGYPLLLNEGLAYGELVNQPSVQDASFDFVVPFMPEESLLYLKVSEDNPPVGSTMPLFSERLTSDELGLIRDWIAQGAEDN